MNKKKRRENGKALLFKRADRLMFIKSAPFTADHSDYKKYIKDNFHRNEALSIPNAIMRPSLLAIILLGDAALE